MNLDHCVAKEMARFHLSGFKPAVKFPALTQALGHHEVNEAHEETPKTAGEEETEWARKAIVQSE